MLVCFSTDTSYWYKYPAGFREYRAGSEINIQNKVTDSIPISSWLPRIWRWLWDQHSNWCWIHTLNIELIPMNIALALTSTLKSKFEDTILLSSWMPGISHWLWDQHSKYSWIHIFYIEMDVANITLAQRSTFKINLLTLSQYRAGCCEYRTGSEINIKTYSLLHILNIQLLEAVNIALALTSIFKVKWQTISQYRDGCLEFRAAFDINIGNKGKDREYWAGSEFKIQTVVEYTFRISSWMPWISRWLWHQYSQ